MVNRREKIVAGDENKSEFIADCRAIQRLVRMRARERFN